MISNSKRDSIFVILAGIFITNAVVAEVIGAKLITLGPFTLSMGILPWPIVFLTTDLINEYFGRNGVRKLSLLTAALIAYAFVVIFFAMQVPASPFSNVGDAEFNKVLGQSQLIIVGSITAFLVGQLVDVFVFWFLRERTGGKMLWLRATGSTVVSQLVDSFIVLGIAFYLPDVFNFYDKPADKLMTFNQFIAIGFTGYLFKLVIAVGLTPLIYATHAAIDKYLGKDEAEHLIKRSAEEALHHKVKE
ncbi:MAG: queuosine precursor transporter [Sphingobacteriales bacterium JAD_PAG50586_3]|nr:MAG: queuosine precursor transporter [Sphingobacteriales bacterium JAD_PAG50586_3]